MEQHPGETGSDDALDNQQIGALAGPESIGREDGGVRRCNQPTTTKLVIGLGRH